MKVSLDELKKAVQWIEANSRDTNVSVSMLEANKLRISCADKYDSFVEIVIYGDQQMVAKIKKTENL